MSHGLSTLNLAFVACELRILDIDIAALHETRLAYESQLTEVGGGYTFYWRGRDATDHCQKYSCKQHGQPPCWHLTTTDYRADKHRQKTERLHLSVHTHKCLWLTMSTFTLLVMTQFRRSQLLTRLLYSEISMLESVLTVKVKEVIGRDGEGIVNANGLMPLTECAEIGLVI